MSTSSGTVEFSSIAILWGAKHADDISGQVETLEAKSSLIADNFFDILGGADNGAKIVSTVDKINQIVIVIIWTS